MEEKKALMELVNLHHDKMIPFYNILVYYNDKKIYYQDMKIQDPVRKAYIDTLKQFKK